MYAELLKTQDLSKKLKILKTGKSAGGRGTGHFSDWDKLKKIF